MAAARPAADSDVPLLAKDYQSRTVGEWRSRAYHGATCRAVAKMKAENRVEFRTAAEAEAKGYHRAGDCR